jgi:hypothetical protein
MVFICERRSGSCVVGVYVDAALGTRTGVVGSVFMVSGEGDIGALRRQCTRLCYSRSPRDSLSVADWKQASKRHEVGFLESNKATRHLQRNWIMAQRAIDTLVAIVVSSRCSLASVRWRRG